MEVEIASVTFNIIKPEQVSDMGLTTHRHIKLYKREGQNDKDKEDASVFQIKPVKNT